MTINLSYDDHDTREVLNGIYPILNFDPLVEIPKVLDWALGLSEAGIRIVQVRAKRYQDELLVPVLDEIVPTLKGSGLRVIINDYVELVGITGADGVHLGIDDFPIFEARALLGPKAIIGATCRNHADALLAIGQGASYVAAGSVYESPTKQGIPVIGIDSLMDVVTHIYNESVPRTGWGRFDHVPVCAIGGVNKSNLMEVFEAGASMAAVIGAVQDAPDPVAASKELVHAWNDLLSKGEEKSD